MEMAAIDMVPRKICLVEDHILEALKSKEYGHSVTWEDEENGSFRIPWFGEYRPGTRRFKEEYANFFLDWDRKKGRSPQMTSSYISKSKERVRNALRKSPKVREHKTIGIYKRYQITEFEATMTAVRPLELQSSSPTEKEFDLQCQVESPQSVNSDCRASESGYDSGPSPSPGSDKQCFDQVPGNADQIPQISNGNYLEVCSGGQYLIEANNQIIVENTKSMLDPIDNGMLLKKLFSNNLQVLPGQPSECNTFWIVHPAEITEMSVSSENESGTATSVFKEKIPEYTECNKMETAIPNESSFCQNIGVNNMSSSPPSFNTNNLEVDSEHCSTKFIEQPDLDPDMEWESSMITYCKELPDLTDLYGDSLLPSSPSNDLANIDLGKIFAEL